VRGLQLLCYRINATLSASQVVIRRGPLCMNISFASRARAVCRGFEMVRVGMGQVSLPSSSTIFPVNYHSTFTFSVIRLVEYVVSGMY